MIAPVKESKRAPAGKRDIDAHPEKEHGGNKAHGPGAVDRL